MHQACSCRSYVEANPAAQKLATAREVLDSLSDKSALYVVDDAPLLASRVEKVLALHEEWDEQPVCRGCGALWPCPTVRILNGEP